MFRLLFLFSLILFTSLSFPQQEKNLRAGGYARLSALGNNPYVLDVDNLKTNPAFADEFNNMIWGDIGSSIPDNPSTGSGQFAGFNFKLNKQISVGGFLTRKDFLTSSIGALDLDGLTSLVNSVPGADIIPLDNNLELFASLNMDNIILGLGVAYASTKNETTPASGTGNKNNASQIGINAGLILKLNSSNTIDAGVTLIIPSASYEPAAGLKTTASQTVLWANARMFMAINQKLSLVPTIKFLTVSGKTESAGNSSDMNSYNFIDIGLGINYRVGDLLLAGGPSLLVFSETNPAVLSISPELKNSYLAFPGWNLGAEFYLTDWLIGRLGYVAETISVSEETRATPTTKNVQDITSYYPGDVRLGLGLRFGGFALDATVNDDVLRQGLNLIGSGTPTFGYISASYAF